MIKGLWPIHLYSRAKYDLTIQESSIYAMGSFCLQKCLLVNSSYKKIDIIFYDFHIFDILYSSVGERVCGKLYEERSYWTVPARSLFPMWNSISNLRDIILNMIFQLMQSDHWSNVDHQKSTSARWEDIQVCLDAVVFNLFTISFSDREERFNNNNKGKN